MQKGICSRPDQAAFLFFPRKESTLVRWERAKRRPIAIGEMTERRCTSRPICICAASRPKPGERNFSQEANQRGRKNWNDLGRISVWAEIVEGIAQGLHGLA